MVHTLKNNERCPHGIFRRWWIGKNGAQQWSKALDDEGGTLGAIEMIFKAGAATQQARIEALEAEVERRKEAFENQWHLHYEMQRNAWGRVQELESAARGLLSAIEAYQYAQAPAEPLPWLAPQANALAALLESEPTAHTCNASCQRPACVLRRRVEELEAERRYYRAMIAVVHREYIGFTDPEPQDDQQAIDMIGEEWASELPRPPEQEGE